MEIEADCDLSFRAGRSGINEGAKYGFRVPGQQIAGAGKHGMTTKGFEGFGNVIR